MSIPNMMVKIVWMIHFVLTSWALFSGFIAVNTYWFTHLGALAFGFWAMVAEESIDAIVMFMITLAFSILNDIICLGLYEPRGHDTFERSDTVPASAVNEYRFALGMSITNLIVKPLTIFLLYRVYQSRASGSEFNTGIPGIDRVRNPTSGYSNIDEPYPGVNNKATAPGNYQEPPLSSYHQPPVPEPGYEA